MRIEIDHDQQDFGLVGTTSAVANQFVVIDFVELQPAFDCRAGN